MDPSLAIVDRMMVTRSAHEDALDCLAAQLDALQIPANSGIHGPQSVAWRVNAEAANFLGAGCAVLMQLAHPYVAYGIAEHSSALTDVRRRFQGTFESIYRMTFGSRDEAFTSARAIHRVHGRITGSIQETVGRFASGHRYRANEVGALRWVYSTLISTAMAVHTETGLKLSRVELAEFYSASKRFALLFGLRDSMLPTTLGEFEVFVRDTAASDTIVVSKPAREIASFLLTSPTPSLAPMFTIYRAVTAKFLGAELSHAYGLPYVRKEAVMAKLALSAAGPLRRLSPAGLRCMPDALRAEARLGLRAPNRLSPLVEKALHRGLDAWPARK